MAVLIAKFVPTVRRLVNFFQRHVTEPTKPENVDDLEEVAGHRANCLSARSACFEMRQEQLAFPCQGRRSVARERSRKRKILVENHSRRSNRGYGE
jgi:hypothetical protein